MNPVIGDIYKHFGHGGKIMVKKISDKLYAVFAEIKYIDFKYLTTSAANKAGRRRPMKNTVTYSKEKHKAYSTNPDITIDKIYYTQKRIGFLRPEDD